VEFVIVGGICFSQTHIVSLAHCPCFLPYVYTMAAFVYPHRCIALWSSYIFNALGQIPIDAITSTS
jgi:hypothetical protein